MGLFKKKAVNTIQAADTDIVAIADAVMIPLEQVSDEVFSQKMMGDGVAFELKEDTIVSPANGQLAVVFPTGHAYGIAMKDGTELMVHIGINTVESNGDGFKILVKQGAAVRAGDPLVKLDMKKLKANYDMTAMLIVTAPGSQDIKFTEYGDVTKGQKINL